MNTGKGDPDFDIIQKTFMLVGIKYKIEEKEFTKIIHLLAYNKFLETWIVTISLIFSKEGQYLKTD